MKGQRRHGNKNRDQKEKSGRRKDSVKDEAERKTSVLGWSPNDTQKPRNPRWAQPLLSLEAPACPEHRADCHRSHRESQGPPAKMVPPGPGRGQTHLPLSKG